MAKKAFYVILYKMSLLSIDLSVHTYNYGIFDTIRVHCGFLSKERKTKQFSSFS